MRRKQQAKVSQQKKMKMKIRIRHVRLNSQMTSMQAPNSAYFSQRVWAVSDVRSNFTHEQKRPKKAKGK